MDDETGVRMTGKLPIHNLLLLNLYYLNLPFSCHQDIDNTLTIGSAVFTIAYLVLASMRVKAYQSLHKTSQAINAAYGANTTGSMV